MRSNNMISKSDQFVYLIRAYTAILALSSAAIAGLSDTNYFIPGFNEQDNASFDVGTWLWCASPVFLVLALSAAYKIRQRDREREKTQLWSSIQLGNSKDYGATSVNGTVAQKTDVVRFHDPVAHSRASCMTSKHTWGFLGVLMAVFTLVTFLHVINRSAEKSENYSGETLEKGLLFAYMGVALITALTTTLMFCLKDRESNTSNSGCWARLTSCCGRREESHQTDSIGMDAVGRSFA